MLKVTAKALKYVELRQIDMYINALLIFNFFFQKQTNWVLKYIYISSAVLQILEVRPAFGAQPAIARECSKSTIL